MAGGGIKQINNTIRGGADGATYIPSVSEDGYLSWEVTKGGYDVPERVKIKGEQGPRGDTGAKLVRQYLSPNSPDANGGNVYIQEFSDGTTATFTAPKGKDVIVDNALSFDSENPVENKVVTDAIFRTNLQVSDKMDKNFSETEHSQAYVKNADGTQGMVDIYGKNDWITDESVIITGKQMYKEIFPALNSKQDQLTAGTGIEIDLQGVISATGGSNVSGDTEPNGDTLAQRTSLGELQALNGDWDSDSLAGDLGDNTLINAKTLEEYVALKTIVDDYLSTTSTNPVENKVVTAKFEEQNNEIASINNGFNIVDTRLNEVQIALGTKQDILTFDDMPNKDSKNPVTSGGVFSAIQQVVAETVTIANITVPAKTIMIEVTEAEFADIRKVKNIFITFEIQKPVASSTKPLYVRLETDEKSLVAGVIGKSAAGWAHKDFVVNGGFTSLCVCGERMNIAQSALVANTSIGVSLETTVNRITGSIVKIIIQSADTTFEIPEGSKIKILGEVER